MNQFSWSNKEHKDWWTLSTGEDTLGVLDLPYNEFTWLFNGEKTSIRLPLLPVEEQKQFCENLATKMIAEKYAEYQKSFQNYQRIHTALAVA